MKGLTFIVSDKCNITCDFCAPECGPKLHGHLSARDMIRVYDDLRAIMPVANVVFTGGEPTLFLEEVCTVLRHVAKTGAEPTRIVTNAYWGRTIEQARSTVAKFVDSGLFEFNYSVDDFHQEFIPLNSIKNAVDAALERRVPVLLAHKTYPNSKTSKRTFEDLLGRTIPVFEELDRARRFDELLTFSTGRTIPIGRGSDGISTDEWLPSDLPRDLWAGPCEEVLRNITIQADGALSPCCGLVDRSLKVFYFGSIHEASLRSLVAGANRSTLYNWLALEGPEGIMNEIQKRRPDLHFTGRYLQNCQLCQEIFSDGAKMTAALEAMTDTRRRLSLLRLGHEIERTWSSAMDVDEDALANSELNPTALGAAG